MVLAGNLGWAKMNATFHHISSATLAITPSSHQTVNCCAMWREERELGVGVGGEGWGLRTKSEIWEHLRVPEDKTVFFIRL